MKLRMMVTALAALIFVVPTAQATIYGWEDGGTVLGTYGNVGSTANVSTPVRSGNSALEIVESPLGGTPQAYVAFVEGLTDGDTVTASFWAYDTTPGSSPSARIWGHYATSGDVTNYKGSAGGNSTYSDGNGWSQLSYSWTFDSDMGSRDAFVLEARIYSGAEFDSVYIDDLEITTSNAGATISVAPEPASLALLALGGLAIVRRRR